MQFIKLSAVILTFALFLTACDSLRTDDTVYTTPYPEDVETAYGEDTYWAKDNLELRAVGRLLEDADDAGEFEYLLNSEEYGVNNLDLNGDGYVDYISVAEYEDRYEDERGLTLFTRYGDEIQEICRIIFDRDRYDYYDYPGSRVLLIGNEQIYGDNYYYETNWLEKSLTIVSWLFSDRDTYYHSPYYYDYYPSYYEVYRVVETPVYLTRIERYYPTHVFVRTYNPTITNIKIKSKYTGKTFEKVYAKLAKPTREQINFKRNNPNRPEFVPAKNERVKNKGGNKLEKNPNDFERPGKRNNEKFENRGKPDKPARSDVKPAKPDRPNRPERRNVKPDKPNRPERQNVKSSRPDRPARQSAKPNKPDKPVRQSAKPDRQVRQNAKPSRPNQPVRQNATSRPNKPARQNAKPNKPDNKGKNDSARNNSKGRGKPGKP